VLAEHPLDGDGIGLAAIHPRVELALDRHQPQRHGHVRARPDHADVHEVQPAAGRAVDDADSAPGQPWVDAEHPHALTPSAAATARRPNTCSVSTVHSASPRAAQARRRACARVACGTSALDVIIVREHAGAMAIMARQRRRTATARPAIPAQRPDYRHLPERIDPADWVTGEDVTPPNAGPRRFAINDDVWLIERFIGIG
jgi:hypothetical protein